jgi:hypothetical protein
LTCLAVAGLVVLSGCSGDAIPATDVSSLRVTGERELTNVYHGQLSPNGEWLLYKDSDGSCVRRVDGSGRRCIEPFSGAVWSPDSTRIAYTEDVLSGLEPDVWVFDVESGDARNLTDDGDGAVVDVWPAWTADGKQVRFARGTAGAGTVDLMSVPGDGGEPTRLRSVDGDVEQLRKVVWSGDTVAWLIGPDEGERVVRVADLADGEPSEVMRGEFATLTISADGEYLMADGSSAGGPAMGEARVVPARGGEPEPVAEGNVVAPTWSPEGHAIAYLDPAGTLSAVGEPDGEPKDLGEVTRRPRAPGDRLDWVADVILVVLDGESILLDLEG